MKSHHSNTLGKIFLVIGCILIGVWGYLELISGKGTEVPLPSEAPTAKVSNAPSYFEEVISPTLTMGVVELIVEDREKVANFYRDIVGFDTIGESATTLDLGENGQAFLRLIEVKGLTFPKAGEAGLYHIAITHNSRKDLAQRLKNISEKEPVRYQGSADHGATEAFYFSDPEGNGVELYYDKPRKDWPWKDGKPVMGSTAIDALSYIENYADLPVGGGITQMGHIHLKVGNIAEAKKFYEDILLFEEMNDRGDALFISRDLYHHHLGMNTWESAGAGKRTPNTYGLRSFELRYTNEAFDQIVSNLQKDSIPFRDEGGTIVIDDPWGNTIKIRQS